MVPEVLLTENKWENLYGLARVGTIPKLNL